MKKTYLIIAGVTAILLLVAIWVYLLIYGTPKPVEQFFTDFTFSGSSDNTPLEPLIPPETEAQVDIDTTKLRQLTTRPVIGMGEYTKGEGISKITYIRYAEAGTGHIYAINIITGEETRISNATVAGASRVEFSPNGQYAAIASGYTNQNTITLVTFNTDSTATTKLLSQKMIDFNFSANDELRYTEYSSSGQTGRVIDPETLVGSTLFTVPFQSATVVWSIETNTPNYVYPKTSVKLPGYLYVLNKGGFKRLEVSGVGLSALANSEYVVSTQLVNNTPLSRSFNPKTGSGTSLPIVVEPSKCAMSLTNTNIMYCGNEQKEYGYEFPDNWYKGLVSFNDRLFEVDLERGSAAQLVSPEATIGRQIDVIHMTPSENSRVLYFMNKNDNTLWMYEI